MKSLLLLTIVAALVVSSQQRLLFSEYTKAWQNGVHPHVERCVAETDVRRDLAERVLVYGEFVEDPKLKCYINCVARAWGVADDKDGSSVIDKLFELASYDPDAQSERAQVVQQCHSSRVDGDPCETTFRAWKCGYEFLHETLTAVERQSRPKQTFKEIQTLWHSYVLKHYHECVKETGADPDQALGYIKNDNYVEDPKFKCYVACLLKKSHLINADGSAHNANFKLHKKLQFHDPSVLNDSQVEKCYQGSNQGDSCEKGYRLSKCVFDTIKNHMTSKSEL